MGPVVVSIREDDAWTGPKHAWAGDTQARVTPLCVNARTHTRTQTHAHTHTHTHTHTHRPTGSTPHSARIGTAPSLALACFLFTLGGVNRGARQAHVTAAHSVRRPEREMSRDWPRTSEIFGDQIA